MSSNLSRWVLTAFSVIALLKLSESWLFGLGFREPQIPHLDELDLDPLVALRRHEREFFQTRREPLVKSRRCDACRSIAHSFDMAFAEEERDILGMK